MYIPVEDELPKLVNVLINRIPSLLEIRLFGSYFDGNWNKDRSDIDIFSLTAEEYYSFRRDNRTGNSCGFYYIEESLQRKNLRDIVKNDISAFIYRDRFHIHIVSREDLPILKRTNEGRGFIGVNMKKGRLLYKKTSCFDKLIQYFSEIS
ncbi:MAG: nucleotidyltransferase domain-containing protein [Nanoarchaeota archaeon]